MPDLDLLGQAAEFVEKASTSAEEYSGVVESIKAMIVGQFGENGWIAACVAVVVLALVLVTRLAKISFSALKYLVVPSIVLAGLASYLLGFSFVVALPVTVTACSLVMLFKA